MENTTAQEKVIDALATAWNLYYQIPPEDHNPDDTPDFRKCIHDAQRIMFTQLKLKEMKDLKNQPSVFDNPYHRTNGGNTIGPTARTKSFSELADLGKKRKGIY